MVGAVGADDLGDEALRELAAEGIDVAAVARLDGVATGVAAIVVDERGENQIAVASGANAQLDQAMVEQALARLLGPGTAGVVLLGHEVPEAAVVAGIRAARAAGWPRRAQPGAGARAAGRRSTASCSRRTPTRRARWPARRTSRPPPAPSPRARARRCWSRSARTARCCSSRRHAERLPAPAVDVGRHDRRGRHGQRRARRRARRRPAAARGGAVRDRRRRALHPGRRARGRACRAATTCSRRYEGGRRARGRRRRSPWAGWIEPRRLVTVRRTLELPRWPAALDGVRLGLALRPPRRRAARRAEGDRPRGRAAQRRGARRDPAARRLHRRPPAVGRPRHARARSRASSRALRAPLGVVRRARQPRLEAGRRPDVAGARRRRHRGAREPRGAGRRLLRRRPRRPSPPPARPAERARRRPARRAGDPALARPGRLPVRARPRRAHALRPPPRRPGGDPGAAPPGAPVALRRALRARARGRGRPPPLRVLGLRDERPAAAPARAARGGDPGARQSRGGICWTAQPFPSGSAEEHEPAPREVLDVADLDAAAGELVVRGLDVRDHELQALDASRARWS